MEADPLLDGGLLAIAVCFPSVRVRGVLGNDELPECLTSEVWLPCQVPSSDQITLRVRRKPALAAAQELLDLRGAHPVVLLVVEDRDQDVQVREQVADPNDPG